MHHAPGPQLAEFVSYNDRKHAAADLRTIYTAADADHAADQLQASPSWTTLPDISQNWLSTGSRSPVPRLPPEVRRVIYTTNSIQALHRQTRKIIKTRGHFRPRTPTGTHLPRVTKAETRRQQVLHWQSALAAFKIQFPDRIPDSDI